MKKKKKKKKKKQRDSLAVRLVSLSFSLVDSNFFIFVCCGLLRQRSSDGCGKVEAWGSAKVQRKSSESIQYQCVWTIFVYDKSKSLYIYICMGLSLSPPFLFFALPISLSSSLTFLWRGALAALPARTLSLSLHLHAYTRTLPLLSFLSLFTV